MKQSKEFSEKPEKNKWDKTRIIIRTQEEIDDYNKTIGYRKSRKKRYGKSGSK